MDAHRIGVGILGSTEIRVGPDRPTITGARLRRLLVRLAVDAGSLVSTGELLDAVWPDGESRPDGATNALQSLVSRLRRVLADASVVAQLPGGYRLAVDRSDVDAHQFTALAVRGRGQLRAGAAEVALTTLEAALALWRGTALADADGAEYAEPVVARLGEQRLQASTDLFDAHIALGRAADVVAPLEELAAADQYQEALTGRLMTALSAAGRTADALSAYQRLRDRLADELGVDPDPRLQAQHLALLRGETVSPAQSPGWPSPGVRPPRRTNIRASLTSFVGREVELQRIGSLLDTGRLTTIIGPGGAGKTRLSAHVAVDWQDRVADGVWMIELAPVTEAADLPQAVLSALGLREARVLDRRGDRSAQDSADRLFEVLEDADTLLVVDNCEHLIGPIAELVDTILARCPAVRVLATSREPLGVVGESLCLIPPLGLPPALATAEEATDYPAVRLLIERAASVSADFHVEPGNVRSVVDIVRRLDGLPLAIELVAAGLRVLPVAEMAARLGDRFRLLTGGHRTAVPRHRTLRAVVEWSWDLLTPEERLLAERLSIFPAGATEDAAAVVCGDDRLPADSIPRLLLSLVDKSLLQVAEGVGLRFRMLETIREYGVERLAERAEAEAARNAHARYFATLAERAEPVLRSRDQLAAMATLNAEQGNIVAALRFLGDSGDVDRAIGLALSLMWHWSMTASHTDIVTAMDYLLELPAAAGHRWLVFVKAVRALSALASGQTGYAVEGSAMKEHFGAIVQELETEPRPPWAAVTMIGPTLAFFSGDDKRGLRLAEALLEDDDPWIRAAVRTMRAAFAENLGDVATMEPDVDAALRDFEIIGDRWGLSTTLTSRAWIRTLKGDLPGAIADYERALGALASLGGGEDDLLVQLRLGGLRLRVGDVEGARESLAAARAEGAGGPHGAARRLFAEAGETQLLLMAGDMSGALALSERLRARMTEREASPWMRGHVGALTLTASAGVALRLGDIEQAATDLALAYPLACQTQDLPIVATVGVCVAGLAMARGRLWQTAHILGASARLRGGDDFTEPTVTWLIDRLGVAGFTEFDEVYLNGRSMSVEACLAALDPAPFT